MNFHSPFAEHSTKFLARFECKRNQRGSKLFLTQSVKSRLEVEVENTISLIVGCGEASQQIAARYEWVK